MPSLFSSVRTRGTGAAMLWRVTFASGHSIHTRHGYSIYPNQLCYISATTACRNMSRGFASILITSLTVVFGKAYKSKNYVISEGQISGLRFLDNEWTKYHETCRKLIA